MFGRIDIREAPHEEPPRPDGRSVESLRGEREDRLGLIKAQGGATAGARINP